MQSDHDSDRHDAVDDEPEMLWHLGRRFDPPRSAASLDDAELEAYRRGAVTAERRAEIEQLLVGDPSARDRLAALAGRAAAAPSAGREQALAAFDRSFAERPSPPGRVLPWRAARRGRLAGALALAASLIVAASLWLLPGEPSASLPPDIRWSVVGIGAAEIRGEVPSVDDTAPVRVTIDGRLRLEATPDRAVAEVDFGIFRRAVDGSLDGVALEPSWIETDRGAARIDATAGELVGDAFGRRQIVLVVAAGGAMPSAAEVAAVLDGERPESATWRAHPIEVEVVDRP
ncbi:MAG: hypothetical protein AAGE94_13670 [Acidobacteriota bacterium]